MSLANKNKYKWIWKGTLATSILSLAAIAFAQENMPNQPGTTPASRPGIPSTRPSPSGTPSTTSPSEMVSQREVYEANLQSLNTNTATPVTGAVRFVVDGSNVGIDLQASGLAPDMAHIQNIRAGNTCPDLSADKNGDGIIDSIEASKVAGPPAFMLTLKPQQGDNITLSSTTQLANYPVSSSSGDLFYINSFPAAMVTTALNSQSPTTGSSTPGTIGAPGTTETPTSPTGSTSSSNTESKVNLENHLVFIHGVAPNTSLPSTVQSENGLSATDTIPVACGVIVRVTQ